MLAELRRALFLLSLIPPGEILFLVVLTAATCGLLSVGGM